jgi:hypothetical protein
LNFEGIFFAAEWKEDFFSEKGEGEKVASHLSSFLDIFFFYGHVSAWVGVCKSARNEITGLELLNLCETLFVGGFEDSFPSLSLIRIDFLPNSYSYSVADVISLAGLLPLKAASVLSWYIKISMTKTFFIFELILNFVFYQLYIWLIVCSRLVTPLCSWNNMSHVRTLNIVIIFRQLVTNNVDGRNVNGSDLHIFLKYFFL